MYDVVIIGAGIAGACAARELSRYDASVHIVDAGLDVAWGASRTNSAIIHGGYDPQPGTNKARFNVEGASMWPELAAELGVRYVPNGSMVLAFTEAELAEVDALVERGGRNGVPGVSRLTPEEVIALEPAVNPEVKGALLCTHSGIIDPFMATVACVESALENGATISLGHAVDTVERDGEAWKLTLDDGSVLEAKAVVNAAGTGAFDLHNQVSGDRIEGRPRGGEYVVLSRDTGATFSRTMFQAPTELGKGVLVAPTVEGNTIVGPDSYAVCDPEDKATSREGLALTVAAAKKTWPGLPLNKAINNFAGVRPSGADGDFVIGEPEDAPGFFDIAAFDSPGLTSAPAVAAYLAPMIAERVGASRKDAFNSRRGMPFRFLEATGEERAAAAKADPAYGHIVCRCERVTEGEIVAAVRSCMAYATPTIQAVKRRCRATAGKCQGGFCEPAITRIIAREAGIDPTSVLVREPGSEVAPHPFAELAQNGPARKGEDHA